MILVLCFDDGVIFQAAAAAAGAHPHDFGLVYRGFTHVPQLPVGENLFITAHGVKIGDDGNPVIGDAHDAFWVNAVDLMTNLSGVFPAAYRGAVYISACESADNVRGSFSFAEVFKARFRAARRYGGSVYGQRGAAGLGIPTPGSAEWIAA